MSDSSPFSSFSFNADPDVSETSTEQSERSESLEIHGGAGEFEERAEAAVFLDQNAGTFPSDQILEETYKIYRTINNLHGYTNNAIMLRKQIEVYRTHLLKLFQFDHVFFTTGSSEVICFLHEAFGKKLIAADNQHPLVDQLQTGAARVAADRREAAVLINLITSQEGIIQTDQITQYKQKNIKYIIIDASQAISQIKLPVQKSENHDQAWQNIADYSCDGLFFSCHKIGGLFNTGLFFASNELYEDLLSMNKTIQTKQLEDEINHDFMSWKCGTFDIPGFITSYMVSKDAIKATPDREGMKKTYASLLQIVQKCKQIEVVDKGGLASLHSAGQTKSQQPVHNFSTILFKFTTDCQTLCVRSFQNRLSKEGVIIGFATACQSGKDGVLRLSWKAPISDADMQTFGQVFPAVAKQLEIDTKNQMDTFKAGGQKGGNSTTGRADVHGGASHPIDTGAKMYTPMEILKKVNENMFWLRHHWTSSKFNKIKVPKKYQPMFQDFILRQKIIVDLIIPDVEPSKKQVEAGIKGTLPHRVSKYLWINMDKKKATSDAEIVELKLSDFKDLTKMPDIISQIYEEKYWMSGIRNKFIKEHNLNIEYEYEKRQNPMNEYVYKLLCQGVKIKELLISTSNMYCNNVKYPTGRTPGARFRGEDDKPIADASGALPEPEKKPNKDNQEAIDKILKEVAMVSRAVQLVGGGVPKMEYGEYSDKYTEDDVKTKVLVVQPYNSTKEMQKGFAMLDELVKNSKAKVVFVVKLTELEVMDKYVATKKFTRITKQYSQFDNWQHYWYSDPNYQIYVMNVNFGI